MSFLVQAILIALVSSWFRYLGGWPGNWVTSVAVFVWSWLIGLICGDARQGLILGAMVQTVNIVPVYVGGVTTMDLWFSTTLVVPLVLISGMDSTAAVALAAPLAVLANVVLNNIHQVVICDMIVTPWCERLANNGDHKKIGFVTHIFTPIVNVLFNFVFTFIAVYAGTLIASSVLTAIPDSVMSGFNAAAGLLPAVGISLFLRVLGKTKFLPYFFAGFYLFYYAKLPTVAIGIIGLILAFIFVTKNDDTDNQKIGDTN